MTIKQIFKLSAGAIGAMAISMPAQAGTFTGFDFTATITQDNAVVTLPNEPDPTKDIYLDSVSYDGIAISDFSLVTGATVAQNNGPNGPASTDFGDNATNPTSQPNEQPTGQEVVDFLGNLNLNNIIDSEDDQESTIELEFDKKVNTFYFFERGLNSALTIEALDSDGFLTQFKIEKENFWKDAGYDIDTQEIDEAQSVGAYGVKFDSSVKSIRIVSAIGDNGPDYKVVAAQVPEPGSMAALALLGGGALLAKRRKQAA